METASHRGVGFGLKIVGICFLVMGLITLLWIGVSSALGWAGRAFGWELRPWLRSLLDFWTTLLILVGLVTVAAHMVHRRRPMVFQIFSDAFSRIGQGDFTVQVPVVETGRRQKTPFFRMAQNLNAMTRALAAQELDQQKFADALSQEIQSPLGSILGVARTLRDADLPESDRRRYLSEIEIEARRLGQLSGNLLKLNTLASRKNRTPLSVPFRLDVQLGWVLSSLEPQWGAKELQMEVDLPEITVTGDRQLWEQVWISLIHNAVKASPKQGRIRVGISAGPPVTVEIEDSRTWESALEAARIYGASGPGAEPEAETGLVDRIATLHGATILALGPSGGRGMVLRVTFPGL